MLKDTRLHWIENGLLMDINCMRFSFIDGRFRGHQFRARYRFQPQPNF